MSARARQRRTASVSDADSLDLMPMMNIFVALIPMLLASAVFLHITVIDTKAPVEGESSAAAATAVPAAEELSLAVTITGARYVIEGEGLAPVVIERNATGANEQLGQALATIAIAHPGQDDVMIVSQPDTRYDDIIAVMDLSRDAGLPGASLLAAK